MLAAGQKATNYLQERYAVGERRTCKVLAVHHNTQRAYECKTFLDLLGKDQNVDTHYIEPGSSWHKQLW